MISRLVLSYVSSLGNANTSQIESYAVSHGFRKEQAYGAIGYCRSQGLLQIVSSIENNDRLEHIFTV